jgi:hypothetical protein
MEKSHCLNPDFEEGDPSRSHFPVDTHDLFPGVIPKGDFPEVRSGHSPNDSFPGVSQQSSTTDVE